MKKFSLIICAAFLCAMSVQAQTPAASANTDVDCGQGVEIEATPVPGFHFVQWEDDATEPNPRQILNIKEATLKSYKAIFAQNEAIDPAIEDPNNPTPDLGDVLQLTPKTDDDCLEFWHWSDIDDPDDPLYAANPRQFTYQGVAPTFTAVFKTKVFNVEVVTETGDTSEGSVTVTIIQQQP